MIDEPTLLRNVEPNVLGVFLIFKAAFIVEGENSEEGTMRCDNIDFGPVSVVHKTPYEHESLEIGTSSQVSDFTFSVREIKRYEHVIVGLPNYYITYMEFPKIIDQVEVMHVDIEEDPTPQMMWVGKNFHHLLKIMREWSFIFEEPFNSDHPMAEISKKVYEHLNPPAKILAEIDGYPDMHLAKFLKGQDDYRKIPEFPDMSEDMKQWVLGIVELYAPQ
jgi:hypothetical protein